MAEIVAANVVASRPPNANRLQRRYIFKGYHGTHGALHHGQCVQQCNRCLTMRNILKLCNSLIIVWLLITQDARLHALT